MEINFKYYSLVYLNQWLEKDREYCEGLASDKEETQLEAIRKAANFYGIARNFSKDKKDRYQKVLEILGDVNEENLNKDPTKETMKVVKSMEYVFDKKLLSATTKFLWLKFKHPIRIYDSRAVSALKGGKGNLSDYNEAWNKRYEEVKGKIVEACKELEGVSEYVLNQELKNQELGTKAYIKKISSENWFHERVFDIYLWSEGKGS